MAWMIAIYMILSAVGQGPNAIGMTGTQVINAQNRYTATGVLPTVDNIKIPYKPSPKTSYSRRAQ